jgi:NodT family efflux transporter outer membrane factor (OMF) lipoprotein
MSRTGFAAVASLAALALAAGCAVGPNYRPPPAPVGAEAPLVSRDPALETAGAPPDAWWRLYDDARLDGYVAEAFAANTDLAQAESNLGYARAVLEAARDGRYPQTSTDSGAVYGRDATTDAILGAIGEPATSMWKFDSQLDVSYELDLFGRVRRSIEASRADAAAAAAERDSVRITVAAETARAYAEVCALGEELAVARRSIDVATREADITVQRRAAGAGTEFDVVRAQGFAAEVRASVPPLEGRRRAAVFELAALLGRTPAHAPAEAEACTAPPRLAALIPVGDGASLLTRRPDVRQAERQLAAATARIGVATADLYPRITLTGFYGGAGPSFSDVVTQRMSLTWGVGPAVSWSFPNFAGPRARIHQAKSQASSALVGFDGTVLQALKETEQSLVGYRSELDHRQALADVQAKAHRAFEIANGQYRAGSASTLDLLVAEQTQVAADADVAASDAALIENQISVFKALGGGWNRGPPARTAAASQ